MIVLKFYFSCNFHCFHFKYPHPVLRIRVLYLLHGELEEPGEVEDEAEQGDEGNAGQHLAPLAAACWRKIVKPFELEHWSIEKMFEKE